MKKIFYTSFILIAYFLVSCEEKEVIFDESAALVSFNDSEHNYAVIPNSDPGFEILVGVSNLSDTDRRFTVSVDTDRSTATSDMYTIEESSLVIPAGEYIGKLRLNSDFNELPESGSVRLVLILESVDNAELHGRTLETSVFLFRFCPFDDGVTFTGDYIIESVTGVFGGTFPQGEIITLREGENAAERTFITAVYPGAGTFNDRTIALNLICDDVVVPTQSLRVGCGAGLFIGAPSMISTYNPSDDSELVINYTDNVNSDCSGGPTQATMRLVKQ